MPAASASTPLPAIPVPFSLMAREPAPAAAEIWTLAPMFGWSTLHGTVIAVDPTYMAAPETNTALFLAKLALFAVLLPVLLGLGITLFFTASIWKIFHGHNGREKRPGLVSELSREVLGYLFTKKLFGSKPQEPVRDFRLRDEAGIEHLVRIRGEFVTGNVATGDEVEVSGCNRRGTLNFKRGVNRRTRSEIRVRRP